jgi:ADP-ribose pyrophosphatase YjhB (NUDIX family)
MNRLTIEVMEDEGGTPPGGLTRGDLITRAAVGAGVVAAGGLAIGGLPDLSASKPSASQDVKILGFVLLFERLQSAFYAEALQKAGLKGELRQYATVVGSQERAHVAFLEKALGSKAGKAPAFDFKGTTSDSDKFAQTARQLEDLGVGAYNGQAPNLTTAALTAAGRIVSVEARHASWIRDILGEVPAPRAVDTPVSATKASAAVDKTGFVR